MRTRIFLFLFFASTSGLWAQEARQVREVREERGDEAPAQEANPAQGDIDRGAGAPAVRGNNGRVVNRRIRVGEKKDEEVQAQKADIRLKTSRKALNGPAGNGDVPVEAVDVNGNPLVPLVPSFVRGDVNGDSQISIADAIAIMFWFSGPGQPHPGAPLTLPPETLVPCHDAADADDDGYLTNNDAMTILRYVFRNRPLPAPSASAPNYLASDCGEDLTEDDLGCDVESAACN